VCLSQGVTQFVAELAGTEVTDQRFQVGAGLHVVALSDRCLSRVVSLGELARLLRGQGAGEKQAARRKQQAANHDSAAWSLELEA